MVDTLTPAGEMGWQAREFSLPATDGKSYSLADVQGAKGTVVMFICNHCPFVRSVIRRTVEDMAQLRDQGVAAIAVMSNDTTISPGDGFEKMQEFARANGIFFPYVIDESQHVARAFGAVCTPDFFGFDAELRLRYRGRLDASGRNTPSPDTDHELLAAMTQVAATGTGPASQHPSIGCSIKWRA